jgi:L-arabinokinase
MWMSYAQMHLCPGGYWLIPSLLRVVQSHSSYGRCGLGSDGTDRLVALVQALAREDAAAGEAGGLYGAKITGGGSGGNVCVLGAAGEHSRAQIKQVSA